MMFQRFQETEMSAQQPSRDKQQSTTSFPSVSLTSSRYVFPVTDWHFQLEPGLWLLLGSMHGCTSVIQFVGPKVTNAFHMSYAHSEKSLTPTQLSAL